MSLTPLEAARMFIETVYPKCGIAILAGSVVQGEATPSSDLDLIIFDDSQSFPYRKTYCKYGWIIEAFVLTHSTYEYLLTAALESAIPSLMRMCVEGIVIRDDGSAAEVVQVARKTLEEGPLPWTTEEINKSRYEITEGLLDLEGSRDRAEALFIVGKLSFLLHEFILRSNRQWIGDGKWCIRTLQRFDRDFCNTFITALDHFYRSDDVASLAEIVRKVLEKHGGTLLEGYTEGCPPDELDDVGY